MDFYIYTWMREDGSPYYVGKGKGRRAFERYLGHMAPKDSRIRIFPMPDEDTAFAYEVYLIDFWGRKDLGTGCLRNLTNGGDGVANPSDETRRKIAKGGKSNKGRPAWNKGIPFPPEFGRKVGLALKGRSLPDITKDKMKQGQKLRWEIPLSEMTRQRMSKAATKREAVKRIGVQ